MAFDLHVTYLAENGKAAFRAGCGKGLERALIDIGPLIDKF